MNETRHTKPRHCEHEVASEELSVVVTVPIDPAEMDVGGVALGMFRKNPVVLLNHRADEPPAGKALWVRALPGRLVAKIKFVDTDEGRDLFRQYTTHREGYDWCMGYLLKEEAAGVVKEWELVELSLVAAEAVGMPEGLTEADRDVIKKAEALEVAGFVAAVCANPHARYAEMTALRAEVEGLKADIRWRERYGELPAVKSRLAKAVGALRDFRDRATPNPAVVIERPDETEPWTREQWKSAVEVRDWWHDFVERMCQWNRDHARAALAEIGEVGG